MANIDNGFNVDILSINDKVLITSGETDPRVFGFEAPSGSLFLYKDGTSSTLLVKKTAPDTGWTTVESSGGPSGVTYVGLNAPPEFSVAGSPITTSGEFTLTKVVQAVNSVYAGPASGGSNTPSFRTLSLSQNDMSDVSITAPATGQLLQYNGTRWVNSSTSANSFSTTVTTWTLLSGNKFYNDITHNLGTTNVVINIYDTSTNQLVQFDAVYITSTNVIRVVKTGSTGSYKVVIVSNGITSAVVAGAPASGTGIVQDVYANRPAAGVVNRLFLSTDTRVLYRDNGSTWDLIMSSAGVIRSYAFVAASLESPVNSSYPIPTLAPTITDPLYNSLTVRSFSDTVEQGVAWLMRVPLGATSVRVILKGRPQAAPAAPRVVQHRMYTRSMAINAALPSWSSPTVFSALSIPTNAHFQEQTTSLSLAAAGMTAGGTYQVELTRLVTGVTGGTNLASPWLLLELTVEFF